MDIVIFARRKHKNTVQDEIFLKFMGENVDIARGFVKGDRVAVDAKWSALAAELNPAGPPVKDVSGWKKAWCDWKGAIKKKLAHNRKESTATGGGPFNQVTVSDVEGSVAAICGIYQMVNGIEEARSFGPPSSDIKAEGDKTIKRPANTSAAIDQTPKRTRVGQTKSLEEVCATQNALMERVVESMESMAATMKMQTEMMAQHLQELKTIEAQKLEVLTKLLGDKN
ncbi:uncharacterized protein [Drosophila takahashii]|uniref:uncharacterized protein n=1 Tax=Drosophila takahashii TaxID=29030 RepID=UPI001CF82AC3|nr:uncharacterized protein LOC108054225 [Drosophila takahashii]